MQFCTFQSLRLINFEKISNYEFNIYICVYIYISYNMYGIKS